MNIKELKESNRIIFECIRGSHLYNLNIETSDVDHGGLFKNVNADWLQLNEPSQEISDEKGDTVYWELRKYMKLLLTANPTVIEFLFIPKTHILNKTNIYDSLTEYKYDVLTKKCAYSYTGYAYSQIKRAKGKNKKVNFVDQYINEKGKKKLQELLSKGVVSEEWIEVLFSSDFLKYLKRDINTITPCSETNWSKMKVYLEDVDIASLRPPRKKNYMHWYDQFTSPPLYTNDLSSCMLPFRSKPVTIDLDKCDCAGVEHIHNMYRVYKNGSGIISDNQIIVKSIPFDKEITDFIGILYFNEDEYEKARSAWRSFWEWMANRNVSRWVEQENKTLEYDQKNMMHTFRLLMESENIVNKGEPCIRFEGEDRDFLMKIRRGEFSYDTLINKAEEKVENIKILFEKSNLPDSVNHKKFNELYSVLCCLNIE